MANPRKNYLILAVIATLLAFFVVMLGAYTRLTDAGLGCPDWPGCYGQLLAPHNEAQVLHIQTTQSVEKVEPVKAWTEMVHRYFAGSLGLMILILFIWAILRRSRGDRQQPVVIPLLLVLLVIFQALLGMWTVTWQLLPLVVMGHLLGGMILTALLFTLCLQTSHDSKAFVDSGLKKIRPWALLGLLIVFFQIFLGGWTSSNYAAIVCPHFPLCQGSFFPPMDFQQAFNFLRPIGLNYDGGGDLSNTAKVTIQMMHRYGAIITATYIGLLSLFLMFSRREWRLRAIGWIMPGILLVQFILGVLNVEWLLPLSVAVMHNGVAALLLLSQVLLVYRVYAKPALTYPR